MQQNSSLTRESMFVCRLMVAIGLVVLLAVLAQQSNVAMAQPQSEGEPQDDLDGDDVADEVRGQPESGSGGEGSEGEGGAEGRVSIRSGEDGGLLARIWGTAGGGRFGQSAVPCGDLNDDGYKDVLIGAPFDGNGKAYVFHGPFGRDGYEELDVDDAAFVLESPYVDEYEFGNLVAPIFDWDGDGLRDLRVRCWFELLNDAGEQPATHIFSGMDGTYLTGLYGSTADAIWDDLAGDLDGDRDVDVDDLDQLNARLGQTAPPEGFTLRDGDLNGDNAIDGLDVAELALRLGMRSITGEASFGGSDPLPPGCGPNNPPPVPPGSFLIPWDGECWGIGGPSGEPGVWLCCDPEITNPPLDPSVPPIYITPGPPRVDPDPCLRIEVPENVVCVGEQVCVAPIGGGGGNITWRLPIRGSGEWSNGQQTIITPPGVSPCFTVLAGGRIEVLAIQGPCRAVIRVKAVGVDLDVDSDNDNGFGMPERDDEEDVVEEGVGSSMAPGKVALVNSIDMDLDGLPDYVDGFDHLDALMVADDTCVEGHFTPVVLELKGANSSPGATVTFTYAASNPQGIVPSMTDPFLLPPGDGRLWTKPANIARDPRPIDQGGDYVPPAEYSLAALGLQNSSSKTFYFEATNVSEAVADALITATLELPEEEISCSDRVAFTLPEVHLFGRGLGEELFRPVSGLIGTTLMPDGTLPVVGDLTPGAFMTYMLKVVDPRTTGISQVHIGDSVLPLGKAGSWYQTPEFIGKPNDVPWTLNVDPLHVVEVGNGTIEWEYNPTWNDGMTSAADALTEADRAMDKYIREATAEMEAQGWVPTNPDDDGAFGKEVHRRVSQRLSDANDTLWKVDLYVDRETRVIRSIGTIPAGGVTGTVQVDAVRLRNEMSLAVGDVFDPDKVENLYEIKTSVRGTITSDQRTALTALMHGRDFRVSLAPRLHSSAGWLDNVKYLKKLKFLGLIGIATASWAIINSDDFDDQLDDVISNIDDANRQSDSQQRQVDLLLTVDDVRRYLNNFAPDETVVNLVSLAAMYEMIGDWPE